MSLSKLPQCGPKRLEALKLSGIQSIVDLIQYLPRKYEDRRSITPFLNWSLNEVAVISGEIIGFEHNKYPRERTSIQLNVTDGPVIELMFYGKAGSFLQRKYKVGDVVYAIGVMSQYLTWQMVHPELKVKTNKPYKGEYLPVYPMNEIFTEAGVTQKLFRKWLPLVLAEEIPLKTNISDSLLKRFGLLPLKKVYQLVHNPQGPEEVALGLKNLKMNELIPISQEMLKLAAPKTGQSHQVDREAIKHFEGSLSFQFTQGQLQSIHQIIDGLNKQSQWMGLLQADVGAGKTLVALSLIHGLLSSNEQLQVAIMAPTEVLAKQLFEQVTIHLSRASSALLTGSISSIERVPILDSLSKGSLQIIVGTHALFQESVSFANLGFVIIDEQHRFGVEQRDKLLDKGQSPDLLMMSATPIPRSLISTVYGHLETVIMPGKPLNRKDSQTRLVPQAKRAGLLDYIAQYIQNGGLVFWVLPKIDGSEEVSVESRVNEFTGLGFNVRGLHGRLSDEVKSEILNDFKTKKTQILVSTTVIEVGVDIPAANIICIEDADRFGLSQLHQLRGRVGRGTEESWCFLLSNNLEAEQRLKEFSETNDGFKIAELDLKNRGAGDLLGKFQSGWSQLIFSDYYRDSDLIQEVIAELKTCNGH